MVKRCVVHFCSNSNKTGHTISTMHKFPTDANLRQQWVDCLSEESQFRRADGTFRCLQHSFFSGLLQKRFRGGNGAEKAKSVTFWCCMYRRYSLQQQQNRLERFFGSCLQHKMAAQLGHVYQDNPSTNEQVVDRQLCFEIYYTKSTEK